MKLFSTPSASMQRYPCPHFNINAPIFYCPLSFEEYLNSQVRINKLLNEHTVDQHTSPSELTSRIHPLIFLQTPKRFFSPEYILNFFSNLYLTMVAEKFQIYDVKTTSKYICESKNSICSFLLMFSSKTLPQILITTPISRRKVAIPPKQHFLKIYFSPTERGRENY